MHSGFQNMRNDLNSTSTEQISIPSPQTETPTIHNSTLAMNSQNLYLHATSIASSTVLPPIQLSDSEHFSSYRVAQISENTVVYELQLCGCQSLFCLITNNKKCHIVTTKALVKFTPVGLRHDGHV